MTYRVHIDRFDSTEHLVGKQRTYENIKEAALRAGRFSCFEASANPKNARLFTRLMRDPDIEGVEMQYPWVGVKRRGVK